MSDELTTKEKIKEFLTASDIKFEEKPTPDSCEFLLSATFGIDPITIFQRKGKNFITIRGGFNFQDESSQKIISDKQVLNSIQTPLLIRGIGFVLKPNEKKLFQSLTLIDRLYLDELTEGNLYKSTTKINHGLSIVKIALSNVKVNPTPQKSEAPKAGEMGIN